MTLDYVSDFRRLRRTLGYALIAFLFIGGSTRIDTTLPVYPHSSKPSKKTVTELVKGGDLLREWTLYRVDDAVGDIVARHVNGILSSAYAERVDAKDFYHGHFFVADPKICSPKEDKVKFPESMNKEEWVRLFFESSPHFVYHTRENIGPRNPYTGPPRSIIGTLDGKVFPLKSQEEVFKTHGSVTGFEPFEFNGKNYDGMCSAGDRTKINLGNNTLWVASEFFILPDSTGRYTLPNDINFDVFYVLYKLPEKEK